MAELAGLSNVKECKSNEYLPRFVDLFVRSFEVESSIMWQMSLTCTVYFSRPILNWNIKYVYRVAIAHNSPAQHSTHKTMTRNSFTHNHIHMRIFVTWAECFTKIMGNISQKTKRREAYTKSITYIIASTASIFSPTKCVIRLCEETVKSN